MHRTVDTGSWITRDWQGWGLGKEMREAVLAFAFDGLGARVATSEAFLDNAASNGVSRSVGYEDNGRGALAPQGVSRETQRFRMTEEGWRSRPRPPIEIEGLDACREMFGAWTVRAAPSAPRHRFDRRWRRRVDAIAADVIDVVKRQARLERALPVGRIPLPTIAGSDRNQREGSARWRSRASGRRLSRGINRWE